MKQEQREKVKKYSAGCYKRGSEKRSEEGKLLEKRRSQVGAKAEGSESGKRK